MRPGFTGRRQGVSKRLAAASVITAALAGASCSQPSPPSAILDGNRMASIVVGRSSRTDVFTALGRPSRTEQSQLGETWVYEAKGSDSGARNLMGGAAAAAGVVGAFVPFVGLAGPALGLAGAATNATRRETDVVSAAVSFDAGGVVRDCVYSSTALPAGMPGSVPGAANVVGCQRPS